MVQLIVEDALRKVAPDISLGIVEASGVRIEPGSDTLWSAISSQSDGVKALAKDPEALQILPPIEAARSLYRLLGKDPSRYRGSAEALARRILQGKPLYRVNNVVDLNNLISIRSLLPVGSYDRSKVRGDIDFRVGRAGESYKGIGKADINLEGLPIFSDEEGPFGSPTSDSERTMITSATSEVLTVIISFGGISIPMSSFAASAGTYFQTYIPGTIVNVWTL